MNTTSVQYPSPGPERTNHETLIAELGLNTDVVYGVVAGIVLVLGLILTFKGKKYFVQLMTVTTFIAGSGTLLYFAICHKQFSACSPCTFPKNDLYILGTD